VSQLLEIVAAVGVAIAAVWLPGALVIQAMSLLRRRRAPPRSVYIAGPMQDL
jgi:hypothetical protein